jgi:hypothetical protein
MPFIEHNGKRVLFVHIPRTGGTSIEHWMASLAPVRFRTIGMPPALRCTPQHLRMSDYNALFGENYFDYAFTVVRNPYARIESEYRLRAALQEREFFGEAMTFSMWLELSLERSRREPWHMDNHLRPQSEFIGTGVEVHHFEDGLAAVIRKIATVLGVPCSDLPESRLATGKDIAIRWDSLDRERVAERYARDFNRFRYEQLAE